MSWEFTPAQQTFAKSAQTWDAVNRAGHNHILLDARFVAAALRCFGGSDVLLGTNEGGACLLVKSSIGTWQTFQPAQAPLGMLLLYGQPDAQEYLLRILLSLPGLALQLGVLQQDPDFPVFRSPCESSQIELLDYIQTPKLPLAGDFASSSSIFPVPNSTWIGAGRARSSLSGRLWI